VELVSLDVLFAPFDALDAWLSGLLDGAPLLVALGIAFVLGLRHATDPDHLVAVTSLVAVDHGDVRGATRLGVHWGLGHALMLFAVGLPLIAFKSTLPLWLERGAESAWAW
jgi:high-affinity nickel permease